MTASRAPSSVMGGPVVVLMMRMSGSETCERTRLVRVDLNEILRSGHRQHRFDALLNARQLQVTAGVFDQAIAIHQAADGCAVDVGDRCEVDEDVAPAGSHEGGEAIREFTQR